MDTRCQICGKTVDGGELTVWYADSGHFRVEIYLDDLRTSDAKVIHAECFISEHGASRLIELVQQYMIDLAGSLNRAVLHIEAQNDKLREHRLKPLEPGR